MTTLENWSVCSASNNVYLPPELVGQALKGEVYGHPCPACYDGSEVYTTRIMEVEGRVITTRNTVYHLGTIDPKYLQWCKDTDGVHVPTDETPIIMHVPCKRG